MIRKGVLGWRGSKAICSSLMCRCRKVQVVQEAKPEQVIQSWKRRDPTRQPKLRRQREQDCKRRLSMQAMLGALTMISFWLQ